MPLCGFFRRTASFVRSKVAIQESAIQEAATQEAAIQRAAIPVVHSLNKFFS